MNTETLSEIRAKVSRVEALTDDGESLQSACAALDITPRAFRRWKEVLEFSGPGSAQAPILEDGLTSLMPELEASFGRVHLVAGEVLFRLGDFADDMYVLASGQIYVFELEATVGPGEVVGEIGVFSEARRRTGTAIAAEDCELIRIPRAQALELSYRRPSVGLAISQLMADRLARNAVNARTALVRGYLSGIY